MTYNTFRVSNNITRESIIVGTNGDKITVGVTNSTNDHMVAELDKKAVRVLIASLSSLIEE